MNGRSSRPRISRTAARSAAGAVRQAASGEEIAERAAAAALEKKGEDVVVLDLRAIAGFTDFFVIATGRSDRQARAIAESIRDELKAAGIRPARIEGEREASWILLDYLDCVVHVFTPEARDYYRLESLWEEAPRRHFATPELGATDLAEPDEG